MTLDPEKCRECGGDSAVIDSRSRRTHRWRVRRCLNVTCNTRWETYESRISPDDLPKHLTERPSA